MSGFSRSNLVLLLLLLCLAGLLHVLQNRLRDNPDITFEPIPGLPGWRQLVFDNVSLPAGTSTGAVFLGIGEEAAGEALSLPGLCDVLYPKPGEKLQAAIFTDVNCPNCASLELKLNNRLNRIDVRRIELPVLGSRSLSAAKAILAIRLQDPGGLSWRIAAHGRPGTKLDVGAVLKLESAGLDVRRIEADMDGPVVAGILARNAAAADTLGIWGTPGLVIGSTLILGDLPSEVLDRLIDEELLRDPPC